MRSLRSLASLIVSPFSLFRYGYKLWKGYFMCVYVCAHSFRPLFLCAQAGRQLPAEKCLQKCGVEISGSLMPFVLSRILIALPFLSLSLVFFLHAARVSRPELYGLDDVVKYDYSIGVASLQSWKRCRSI